MFLFQRGVGDGGPISYDQTWKTVGTSYPLVRAYFERSYVVYDDVNLGRLCVWG